MATNTVMVRPYAFKKNMVKSHIAMDARILSSVWFISFSRTLLQKVNNHGSISVTIDDCVHQNHYV